MRLQCKSNNEKNQVDIKLLHFSKKKGILIYYREIYGLKN